MNRTSRLLCLLLVALTIISQLPTLKEGVAVNSMALHALTASSGSRSLYAVEESRVTGVTPARGLVLLGLADRERGQLKTAIDYLQRAVQASNPRAIWWFQLADLYFQTGQAEKSQAALNQLESRERLVFHYCEDAVRYGKIKEAKQWCPMLTSMGRPSIEGNCLLGQYYAMTAQRDEAESVFEQVAAQPDVSDECLYQYGRYMQEQQKYEKALSLYTKAFEKRHLPLYLRAQANVYRKTNRADEALAACQQAYDLSSSARDRAASLACVGKVYFWGYEDYEQARGYFQEATENDARVDVSVRLLLARSERQLENSDEAVEAYEEMDARLRGGAHRIRWRHEYAAYLVELGMEVRAHEVYQGILQDVLDDPVAREFLGER